MLIERITPDFSHADDRGSLVQLVHGACDQINVLKSHKGTVRGDHYHKISTESFFVVSGSVEVTCSEKGEQETAVFFEGDFFRIRPYVMHSMRFHEECTLVAFYDICVEKADGTKDIYSQEQGK